MVVLLNLAAKPELDIESSCAHLQYQNSGAVPYWLLFRSFLVIVFFNNTYFLL